MPAGRVNSSSNTINIAQFDVIGKDGRNQFIEHVGLATNSGTQQANDVPVIDMGPPLGNGQPMRAHVVGTAGITVDEQQKIRTFINRHESEHQAVQKVNRTNIAQAYCVLPHATPLKEADGRYTRVCFSCAGFVFEAYKYAGIRLLDVNQLPAVDLAMIQQAYPAFAQLLNHQELRASLGLQGSGPWPVMLCGYLFHALNRTPQQIRQASYVAQSGDEAFP